MRKLETLCIVVVVLALWSVAGANIWSALRDPVELEVREGTVWLYVLVHDAGQSLYDPTQVAFVNMNHGPLDPVLKAALHGLVPALPPQLVTRAFVPLLPIALCGLFYLLKRRVLTAAVWSGALYVWLLGLGPANGLIGRSDPTALCWLVGLLAVGAWWQRDERFALGRELGWALALGILTAGTILTNWRCTPMVLAASALFIVHRVLDCPPGQRLVLGATAGLGWLGAIAGGWWLIVTALFHGDLALYYRHFFGVFTRASGWGTMGRMPFEWLPAELLEGRVLTHLALLTALAHVGWHAWKQPPRRTLVLAWFTALAAVWIATAFGFARNHGAGGVYYFGPWYVMVGYFLAGELELPSQRPAIGLGWIVIALLGLPWLSGWSQARDLARVAADGRRFGAELTQRLDNRPVYSEDLHLFKRRYRGESVDVGDMVTQVAATNYFGAEFRATVRRNEEALAQKPPEFVVVGAMSVVSPALRNAVAARYERVMESPPLILAQGGLRVTVYRLKEK